MWVLASPTIVLCHQSCGGSSWTGFEDAAGGRSISDFKGLRVVLFADDMVLLASSVCDLQHALEWLAQGRAAASLH